MTYSQLDLAVLTAAVQDQTRHAVATGAWHVQAKLPRVYLRYVTLGGTHVTPRFDTAIRDEWRKLENKRRKNEAI